MRIRSFRIQNFRNLRLAERTDVPEFVVICGPNGAGKSALMEALMVAKIRASAYGNLQFDDSVVSADATKADISLTLTFTERERAFSKEQFDVDCPESADVAIEIDGQGTARVSNTVRPVKLLLSYSSEALSSPGYFDFVNFPRQVGRATLQTVEPESRAGERTKETPPRADHSRFDPVSQYLLNLQKQGPLQEIVDLFNSLLAPMKLKPPDPLKPSRQFLISTPTGDIRFDDLSSGEKEMFHTLLRLHQLKPKDGILLIDDADVFIHPDLHERYLGALRKSGQGSQLLLTTRSTGMIMAAGTEALYTVLKEPPKDGGNQFLHVAESRRPSATALKADT
jgi:energy-coupling factor transporter ATP-binding protein EcfA2